MTIDADGGFGPPDDAAAGAPAVDVLRSNWTEVGALLPDVGRLLRDLATDPRVPWRAKLLAGAATGYVLVPRRRLQAAAPGSGFGLDDALVSILAVRHLIAAAGYELVRERWTGSDGGFALLIVLAGVAR